MISLKNIELRLGKKLLLQEAHLLINSGEKASLIGRNGAGKSSLFGLLTGLLHEDAGEFELPSQWQISQVEQSMPETDRSATEFVLEGDIRLMKARGELVQSAAQNDGMAMAQAYSDLADAGDHDAAARAQALILGLGFTPYELHNAVNSFSGGWRMRLQLARALMCPSDLLLLDEPTNHLDLDALIWLETWLRQFEGTLLVISHDREFLDAVTNVTVHLEHTKLHRYNGNYSAFEKLRAESLEQQHAAHAKQNEKMAHLQKYIDRFRYKATKARQAQSRIKALERIEKISAVIADAEFTFAFKEPLYLPNPMLTMDEVDFGYTETFDTERHTILSDIRKSVLAGQRIGILGANGQGKSTFVKTIAHNLKPLAGSIIEGKGLSIGYFAQQELDVLDVTETPLTHMLNLTRLADKPGLSAREQELRNFLGTFNINGDMVTQKVSTLSGGEKARLVLCMIVWQRPNLLLLDEPTNHLDLTTREALAIALNQFDGSVMLVSHDRALLRSVCDEFWLVGSGAVVPFEGDLEDYQRYLLDQGKRSVNDASTGHTLPSTELTSHRKTSVLRPRSANRLKIIERKLLENEQRVSELKIEKARHENRLSIRPAHPELLDIARQLSQLEVEIEALEDCWLQLQEEAEQLKA